MMNSSMTLIGYLDTICRSNEDKEVGDGIYDIADIEIFVVDDEEMQADDWGAIAFMEQYPNFVIAHAYETYAWFLLSEQPRVFSGVHLGSGFNYGSTNILTDCPKALLILAEND